MGCSLAGAVISFCGVMAASGQSFELTGYTPGAIASRVYGMSADGNSVAGYSFSSSPFNPGFRWTRDGGREDFGLEPGLPRATIGFGISGDGSTVVGHAWDSGGLSVAFRWHGPGTFQTLGYVPGTDRSQANGASNDGSIIVGRSVWSDAPDTVGTAFRWTEETGMQGLGFGRPGDVYSSAEAISRDGSTVVGFTRNGAGQAAGFAWTESSGMQVLPGSSAYAYGVNVDGSVIVGSAGSTSNAVAWRHGVIQELAMPAGWVRSYAFGVSDDGNVIVGKLADGLPQAAAVWTPGRGMEPLAQYLLHHGVVVPQDWVLYEGLAVSADGNTFAGYAFSRITGENQGFIASIPSPASMLPAGFALLLLSRPRRIERRCHSDG